MKNLSLPEDYYVQQQYNNRQMEALFRQLFPDITAPYEFVYELLQFLNDTKVNAQILPRVIRGVNNIIIGTGKGQVIVHVCKQQMNVSVRETDEILQTKT